MPTSATKILAYLATAAMSVFLYAAAPAPDVTIVATPAIEATLDLDGGLALVRGQLLDGRRAPLPELELLLEVTSEGARFSETLTTDSEGRFSALARVDDGPLEVQVSVKPHPFLSTTPRWRAVSHVAREVPELEFVIPARWPVDSSPVPLTWRLRAGALAEAGAVAIDWRAVCGEYIAFGQARLQRGGLLGALLSLGDSSSESCQVSWIMHGDDRHAGEAGSSELALINRPSLRVQERVWPARGWLIELAYDGEPLGREQLEIVTEDDAGQRLGTAQRLTSRDGELVVFPDDLAADAANLSVAWLPDPELPELRAMDSVTISVERRSPWSFISTLIAAATFVVAVAIISAQRRALGRLGGDEIEAAEELAGRLSSRETAAGLALTVRDERHVSAAPWLSERLLQLFPDAPGARAAWGYLTVYQWLAEAALPAGRRRGWLSVVQGATSSALERALQAGQLSPGERDLAMIGSAAERALLAGEASCTARDELDAAISQWQEGLSS